MDEVFTEKDCDYILRLVVSEVVFCLMLQFSNKNSNFPQTISLI